MFMDSTTDRQTLSKGKSQDGPVPRAHGKCRQILPSYALNLRSCVIKLR